MVFGKVLACLSDVRVLEVGALDFPNLLRFILARELSS